MTNGGVAPFPPAPGFPGPTVVEGVAAEVVGEAGVAECATAERADIPTDAAANPALLSEPPFLPEGYELDDDEPIMPGTDPDITMSIAAGNPLPDEIRARVLAGDLPVRMRTWRYADAEHVQRGGPGGGAVGLQLRRRALLRCPSGRSWAAPSSPA